MSRPIKFRAWDKRLKIFENYAELDKNFLSEILIHPKGPLAAINSNGKTCLLDEDGYVLQQFTGLLDKNGREIYEGDVVEFKVNNKTETCAVEWDSDYSCFSPRMEDSPCFSGGEIIGNIFENPELLK